MSATGLKHLRVQDSADVAMVDFVGPQLMYSTDVVTEVGDELKAVLAGRDPAKVLLDFRNVRYLSSGMLAQLARVAREVESSGGQLKLCGLGPVLRDALRIGRFDPYFAIYENAESALKSFRAVAPESAKTAAPAS